MSLSPAELVRVGAELERLIGARVQKVYVPRPRTVVLELRIPGQSLLLLLEAEPGVGRVGLVAARPPSPERPIALQGLWRNHLTGARLDHVEVSAPQRTLTIKLATDEGDRLVVVELAPRGGDVLLLDGLQRVISFGVPERARERGLARGQSYRPPESLPTEGARDRLAGASEGAFPVSQAIEQLYGEVTQEKQLTHLRAQLTGPLRTARKRLARTIEKVRSDRERIAEAARYQRLGDLLKPAVAKLKRGDAEARVTEYSEEGPREVVVPLLPNLSPRENMERYYHLHRRLSRSAERVDERLDSLQRQLAELDALIHRADQATEAEPLEAVHAEAQAQGLLRPVQQPGTRGGTEAVRVPYREFRSATGQRIWVGRNARDNDTLTFRYARGNDLWLHARGQTGSHVIVPGLGGEAPDGETLLDAATLAAHFSAARDESFAEVAATRRKYVHKPKNAAPGAVHFSQERTIPLRLEPARLARLLASEGTGPAGPGDHGS